VPNGCLGNTLNPSLERTVKCVLLSYLGNPICLVVLFFLFFVCPTHIFSSAPKVMSPNLRIFAFHFSIRLDHAFSFSQMFLTISVNPSLSSHPSSNLNIVCLLQEDAWLVSNMWIEGIFVPTMWILKFYPIFHM
jgi:hypothetical protein